MKHWPERPVVRAHHTVTPSPEAARQGQAAAANASATRRRATPGDSAVFALGLLVKARELKQKHGAADAGYRMLKGIAWRAAERVLATHNGEAMTQECAADAVRRYTAQLFDHCPACRGVCQELEPVPAPLIQALEELVLRVRNGHLRIEHSTT